jgi:RNA polymerase sigma factor (sigma-70 family)
MVEDQQLLREYAAGGSEAAFGELVARYVNLVYSAALRRAGGDPHLAQDAAQLVFADLARKARSLPKGVVLAGWLHRATYYAAAQLLRTERRRQAREEEAVAMNALTSEPATDWEQLRPLLDQALDRLGAADRDALVLRFFEQRSLAEVGHALGSNEDAARKRVTRALEKLRADLVRRGVTTPAAALSSVIAAHAIQTAPAGLAAALTTASLAGAATGTGATLTAVKLMAMTKLKFGLVSALAVVGVATPLVIQHQANLRLRAENQLLRQQSEQLGPLAAENERLSNLVSRPDPSPSLPDGQRSELLRLRGESTRLRAAGRQEPPSEPRLGSKPASEDSVRQLALAVAQGDPTALPKLLELAKAAHQDFNTNSVGLTDEQKGQLARQVFAPLLSAMDVLREEAANGSQPALQALAQSIATPELQGAAVHAIGALAGGGNESALNVLLEPGKYNIPLATAVGALQPAADSGNQKAIDALAAVSADGTQGPLWYLAAHGLEKAAESGNSVAIDTLIALSGSTNRNVQMAAAAGLRAAAANQNVKAAEALRQMPTP